jgi:hypothetical protein|nr:MAG TPA: hypothetical protein [Caudoviricetes sp.]
MIMVLEIISLILSIILLICFFVLCINVSAIKKSVSVPEIWQASFNFYYSTGQLERAKDVVMKAVMQDSDFAKAFYLNTQDRTEAQKRIETRYNGFLNLVNLTIDFEKANEFISKF